MASVGSLEFTLSADSQGVLSALNTLQSSAAQTAKAVTQSFAAVGSASAASFEQAQTAVLAAQAKLAAAIKANEAAQAEVARQKSLVSERTQALQIAAIRGIAAEEKAAAQVAINEAKNVLNAKVAAAKEAAAAQKQANAALEQSIKALSQLQADQAKQFEKQAADLSKGFGEIGLAAGATAGALGLSAKSALDAATKYQDAVAKVRTLSSDTSDLEAAAKSLSVELNNQASQADILAASYDVLSSGFSETADVAEILRASVKGAVGGFSDVGTVADATTTILNAYNLTAADAARVVDQMAQTQDRGKIVINQYAQGIGALAGIAANVGLSIEEMNAAIATATAKGVQASSAISGVRQALIGLQKPTAEGERLLREFGIISEEAGRASGAAAVKALGLVGILEKLREQGATSDQLAQIFSDVDGLAVVSNLAGENLERFKQNLDAMGQAAGKADASMKAASISIGTEFQRALNASTDALAQFGNILATPLVPFLRGVTAVSTALGNLPGPIKVAVAAVGGLGFAFSSAVAAIAAFELAGGRAKIALIAEALATGKAVATKAIYSATTTAQALATGAFTKQVTLASLGLGGLNKAAIANTIAAAANLKATTALAGAWAGLAKSIAALKVAAIAAAPVVASLAVSLAAIGSAAVAAAAAKLREVNRELEQFQRSTIASGDEAFRLANKTNALTKAIEAAGGATDDQIRQANQLAAINRQKIAAIDDEIKALQDSARGNEAQRAAYEGQIQQLKISRDALEKQTNLLEKVAVKKREDVTATKENTAALQEYNAEYQRRIQLEDRSFGEQKMATNTALAKNLISDEQARQQDLANEKAYLENKLRLNEEYQARLRAQAKTLAGDDQKQALAQIEKLEQEHWQIRQQIAENGNQAIIAKNQAALEKIKQANERANAAIAASARQRETAIAQSYSDRQNQLVAALEQGLITQRQYDKQLLDLRQENERQIAAAAIQAAQERVAQIEKEIAQITALRRQGVISAKEFSDQEFRLAQDLSQAKSALVDAELAAQQAARDVALAAIQEQRAAIVAAFDEKIQASERAATAIEANAAREQAARDRVVASLERERDLLEARAGLGAALAEAEQFATQTRIDGLNRAIEIQQQLNSGQVASAEQRRLLEAELARLGVKAGEDQLKLLARRQAEENRLAQQKRAALLAEQEQQRVLLENEIARNSLLDQQAISTANINRLLREQAAIQAQLALDQARAAGEASAAQLANLEQSVRLANALVAESKKEIANAVQSARVNAEIYATKRQTLQIQQELAIKQFDQAEAARRTNAEMEFLRAKEQQANQAKVTGVGLANAQAQAQKAVTAEAGNTASAISSTTSKIDSAVESTRQLKAEMAETARAAADIGSSISKTTEDFGKRTMVSAGSRPLYTRAEQDAIDLLVPEVNRAVEEAKKKLMTGLDLSPETKRILEQIVSKGSALWRTVGPGGLPAGAGGEGLHAGIYKQVVNESVAKEILKLAESAKKAAEEGSKAGAAESELSSLKAALKDAIEEAAARGNFAQAQALSKALYDTNLTIETARQILEKVEAPTVQKVEFDQSQIDAIRTDGIESRLDTLIEVSQQALSSPRTLNVSSPEPVKDAAAIFADMAKNKSIREGK